MILPLGAPESVVVTAEYPEDFIAVFSINYAAMRYQNRNDQMNQLDGDRARMDIGREECKVYKEGAEEMAAIVSASLRRRRASVPCGSKRCPTRRF